MARGDVDQLSQPSNMTLWWQRVGACWGKTDATSATKEHCYAKNVSPRGHGDHFHCLHHWPPYVCLPQVCILFASSKDNGTRGSGVYGVCIYIYVNMYINIYNIYMYIYIYL